MQKVLPALLLACAMLLPTTPAVAAEVVVVDTMKVFQESEPGKAGAEHMTKVQAVLQKGLGDLEALHKGKENTPEGQQALAQGYAALERQLALEQQAVAGELERLLRQAVSEWRKKNKHTVVLPAHVTIDFDGNAGFTQTIIKEMNKLKPKFPDLPTVTVKK